MNTFIKYSILLEEYKKIKQQMKKNISKIIKKNYSRTNL